MTKYGNYHYKIIKQPPGLHTPRRTKPKIAKDPQAPLTGVVQGKWARADEERFYNALVDHKIVLGIDFRKVLGAPLGLPGQLELDFLVDTYRGWRAFELDDITFVHRGAGEKAEAQIKDARRLEALRGQGYDVMEIEHVDAALIDTDEHAKMTVERLLGS